MAIKLKSKLSSSLSEKGIFWWIWRETWWWDPKLTGNRWWPERFSKHSKEFAYYLPPSSCSCYAPKTYSLHQTHFKERVPIHCAYSISQTHSVALIIFLISMFLYMSFKWLTCCCTETLYCMYDCVGHGCLQISVQTISMNIRTLIPQNILPLKCWRDCSCHFPQWVLNLFLIYDFVHIFVFFFIFGQCWNQLSLDLFRARHRLSLHFWCFVVLKDYSH